MSGQLNSSPALDNPELPPPLSVAQTSEEIRGDFSPPNPDWLWVLGLCPPRISVECDLGVGVAELLGDEGRLDSAGEQLGGVGRITGLR